jgi:hypothetical protein
MQKHLQIIINIEYSFNFNRLKKKSNKFKNRKFETKINLIEIEIKLNQKYQLTIYFFSVNEVKKIEVFFNKLEVPKFMHEWKDLVRPTIQFIGIAIFYPPRHVLI